MNFSKSCPFDRSGSNRVTFKDVAGADEERDELKEIVEFLKAPDRFTKVGARIPKGVLCNLRTGKRCWPARLRAKRACPSSRFPVRIL